MHRHAVYGGNAHHCVVAREWQPNSRNPLNPENRGRWGSDNG